MVPFAGWSMPIQYKESIMDSSIFCRKNAALFDVAHMCGASFRVRMCFCMRVHKAMWRYSDAEMPAAQNIEWLFGNLLCYT